MAVSCRIICPFDQYLYSVWGLPIGVRNMVKCGVAQINVVVSVSTLVFFALARVARICDRTRIGNLHNYTGRVSPTVAFAFGVITPDLQMLAAHLCRARRTLARAHVPIPAIVAVTSLAEGIRTATTTLRPIPKFTSVWRRSAISRLFPGDVVANRSSTLLRIVVRCCAKIGISFWKLAKAYQSQTNWKFKHSCILLFRNKSTE